VAYRQGRECDTFWVNLESDKVRVGATTVRLRFARFDEYVLLGNGKRGILLCIECMDTLANLKLSFGQQGSQFLQLRLLGLITKVEIEGKETLRCIERLAGREGRSRLWEGNVYAPKVVGTRLLNLPSALCSLRLAIHDAKATNGKDRAQDKGLATRRCTFFKQARNDVGRAHN